jgi:hypothetical protein
MDDPCDLAELVHELGRLVERPAGVGERPECPPVDVGADGGERELGMPAVGELPGLPL